MKTVLVLAGLVLMLAVLHGVKRRLRRYLAAHSGAAAKARDVSGKRKRESSGIQ